MYFKSFGTFRCKAPFCARGDCIGSNMNGVTPVIYLSRVISIELFAGIMEALALSAGSSFGVVHPNTCIYIYI